MFFVSLLERLGFPSEASARAPDRAASLESPPSPPAGDAPLAGADSAPHAAGVMPDAPQAQTAQAGGDGPPAQLHSASPHARSPHAPPPVHPVLPHTKSRPVVKTSADTPVKKSSSKAASLKAHADAAPVAPKPNTAAKTVARKTKPPELAQQPLETAPSAPTPAKPRVKKPPVQAGPSAPAQEAKTAAEPLDKTGGAVVNKSAVGKAKAALKPAPAKAKKAVVQADAATLAVPVDAALPEAGLAQAAPQEPVAAAKKSSAKAAPLRKKSPQAAPAAQVDEAKQVSVTVAKKTAKAPQAKAAPVKTAVVKTAPVKTAQAKAAPAPVVPPPVVAESPPKPLGKRAAKKVMMEQMTQAVVVPTHAPDAAKATFSGTSGRNAAVRLAPAPVRKDPKLANHWKTLPLEQLTDQDVLAMPDGEYMNKVQLAYFRRKLSQIKADMLSSADQTGEHLREDATVVPDPADRATIEEEHALELRTRDRERKLLKKIEQALARIDAGEYGYCEETGEIIGVGRLMARPTANLSLEAQQRRELRQKMFGE